LEKEVAVIEDDIRFEEALAELEQVEGVPSELGISYLKGYVPAENVEKMKAAAAENSWALLSDEPASNDTPPTMLRNNPVARLIQPLLSFLGTVPGYREFDISPSYLLFFSIFFAMIFGDAAYGLLILAISAFFGIKFLKKDGKMPDAIKLLILLASCTVVWGGINGAWFAIPYENLPFFLRSLIIPPFNKTGPLVEFPLFMQQIFMLPAVVPVDEFKTRWCIQFLCFTLAVVQLAWARTKQIKRFLPSLEAFAHVGWFLMMLGLYFVVLSMLLRMPLPAFVPWLIGVGFAVVLVFSEQKGGNFFVNIGKGLSNSFSLFLKAVGCFADIISYIRLFAVGLAGGLIGQIFNSLAVPDDGFGGFGLGFIVKLVIAIVLLVFGHGLNLALTALSVIVHGVRLNLLEYAGNHLEMEWSGYEYRPFALKQKNKQ
jgi:V/A-type H+-transporting ATPase subunit I